MSALLPVLWVGAAGPQPVRGSRALQSTTQRDLVIDLYAGWTWFSLCVEADDMSLSAVLNGVSQWELGDSIKNQFGFSDFYAGYGFYGSVGNLDADQMYKLKRAHSSTIHFSGTCAAALHGRGCRC